MQISNSIGSSGSSPGRGAKVQVAGDGGETPPPAEPPTVVRSASSSARRVQAQAAESVPTGLPRPGEVIGTFLLEEAIGAGGMGAVFRRRTPSSTAMWR